MPILGRPRLVVTVALVVIAGVGTGIGAAGKIGPFEALGAAPHRVAARASQSPLSAAGLYPSPTQPATVHQIIEIQDPPIVPTGRPPVQEPVHNAQPTAPPLPSATTPPLSSPSSTPCPDDCQGGGGDT
jgi:hypothetical protein